MLFNRFSDFAHNKSSVSFASVVFSEPQITFFCIC